MTRRVIALGVAAACLAGTAHAAGPSSTLFAQSYDLCRAAPLNAVRTAGGQPYRAGVFANHVCTWERPDLQAGAALATHPPAAGASLIHGFLAQNGRNGIKARRITIPGAARAIVVTMPSQPGRASRYVFAAYRQGTIQVNLTAPGTIAQARLVAFVRLIAHASR